MNRQAGARFAGAVPTPLYCLSWIRTSKTSTSRSSRRACGARPTQARRGATFAAEPAIRDALCAQLGCSDAAAERLVETMVGRGFLRYEGDPSATESIAATWAIRGAG